MLILEGSSIVSQTGTLETMDKYNIPVEKNPPRPKNEQQVWYYYTKLKYCDIVLFQIQRRVKRLYFAQFLPIKLKFTIFMLVIWTF